MTSKKKVALVACGSFNPVTNMHLRMFELARDSLQKTGKYDVIEGIFSPVSDAYPKTGLLAAKHRCAMIQLAVESSDWIRLDSWESEQDQWTPTLTVLQHFQQTYDNEMASHSPHGTADDDSDDDDQSNSVAVKKRKIDANNKNYRVAASECNSVTSGHVHVKLLCGADVLESFAVPGLWKPNHMDEIVGKLGVVVCSRNGSDVHRFIYESDLLTNYKNKIDIVTEWVQNEISSTRIRTAIRRHESVRYLVPDSVIEYIARHCLYAAVVTEASAKYERSASYCVRADVGLGHVTRPCRLLLRPAGSHSRDSINSQPQQVVRSWWRVERSHSLDNDARQSSRRHHVVHGPAARNHECRQRLALHGTVCTPATPAGRHTESRLRCQYDCEMHGKTAETQSDRGTAGHRGRSQRTADDTSCYWSPRHHQQPVGAVDRSLQPAPVRRRTDVCAAGSTAQCHQWTQLSSAPTEGLDDTVQGPQSPGKKRMSLSCVNLVADLSGLLRRMRRLRVSARTQREHETRV